VRPDIRRPDYYLKTVRKEVVYPHAIHNLPNPHQDLQRLNPSLWQALYEESA
jgi:hypothetical protein